MQASEQQSVYRYFASANTANGFFNGFDSIFGTLSHRYIIKGGSGTGKSYLMRQIAQKAQQLGLCVEYFYCSSDPASLDGILLPQLQTCVLDGTPPHTYEPLYPGVEDELIDLGAFWDTHALQEKNEVIKDLIARKKALFSQLYRYLSAAGEMSTHIRYILLPHVQTEKLHKAAKRLISTLPKEAHPTSQLRFTEAISMDGAVAFDSLQQQSSLRYTIRDRYDCGDLFLEELRTLAKEHSVSTVCAPSALLPNRLRTLLLGGVLCVGIATPLTRQYDSASQKEINMDRFLCLDALRQYRQRLRFLYKCKQAFLEQAQQTFAQIKQVHFQLEAQYIPCMDFTAKEAFSATLIPKILKQ